ncbi:FAD-dependent oxidoreductase [Clostridium sp. D2Q-11]|uniref:FAD-dependent oxidoreductase n=1 Tax=Anaeromonas frigoriresistens TaxID=2683708 RepID=A0A942USQ0_9FIRM|nr:NAD(P)/FAD-dependent oxidoreductase [Anaeromonas frigoriresistens]MBS4537240.1 FAD-dependent oxidoreductase [Anaeromonas frigoriresistens]
MIQTANPSTEERHLLLLEALKEEGREGDFHNIIKYLSPPTAITNIAKPGTFKDIKIGIIGGGLAGLSACVELKKLGYNITVFEASDRIGGRVYTHYFDRNRHLYGELGAMRLPVAHEATWYYINKFNLKTRPFVQSNENAFIYTKGVRIRNKEENIMKYLYPLFNLPYAEKLLPYSHFQYSAYTKKLLSIPPEKRVELLLSLCRYSDIIVRLDSLSNRDSYQVENISESAINLVQSINPLERGLFYNSLLEGVTEDYTATFSFLYEIVGGNYRLPESLFKASIDNDSLYYSEIPSNLLGKVTWNFNSYVTGLYCEGNKRIVSYFNKRKELCHEKFDFILCAIPFSSLRNVDICPEFSNRKMQAIRQVNYAPLEKTAIHFKKRFWEFDIPEGNIVGGGTSTDLPIGSIWYPSDHAECINTAISPNYNYLFKSPMDKWKIKKECSPYEEGVLIASYNAGLDSIRLGNLHKPLRDYKVLRQVELAHGLPNGYLDDLVLDIKTINWNRKSFYLGGVCYNNPDQKVIYSYNMTLPELNKTIFFAGEHISPVHGWIQGALSTGMNSANNIAYESYKFKNE